MGFLARIDRMSFEAKIIGTMICLMVGLLTSVPVLRGLGKKKQPKTPVYRVGQSTGYGGGSGGASVPPPPPPMPKPDKSNPARTLPAVLVSQGKFVYDMSATPAGELKLLETTGAETVQLKSSFNRGRNWGSVGSEVNLDAMANDTGRGIWKRIQFTDAEIGWAYGDETGLWRTKDGGASWIEVELPHKLAYPEMAWASKNVGYLAGNVEDARYLKENLGSTIVVLKTTDGGRSWQFVSKFAGTLGSIGQLLAPTETNLLITLRGEGVRRSRDGGASWTVLFANSDIKSVVCDATGAGWFVGERGKFGRFRNFGDVLESSPARPSELQNADWLSLDISAQTGFGIAGGRMGALAVTYDSGATWQAIRLPVLPPESTIDRVMVRGNTAYIFSSGRVFRI